MKIKEEVSKKFKNSIKNLPGIILCIIIALCGKLIGEYLPNLGSGSIAIFLGMAIGNTFGNKKVYSEGTKFAERNILFYSIVLLGGTLTAQTIMKLGASGVAYIIIQMLITITAAIFIGKKLAFSQNFSFLMASGNAVCGSSAIAATAPVIGAEDSEKGIAITIVNVTGTVLMLLLPFLGQIIFPANTIKTSGLIGGVLQSVGQVVASGSLVNEQVKDLATVFKIVRIIFLVFVVLGLGKLKLHSSKTSSEKAKVKAGVPWYVIGFFIMCALFTFGIISPQLSKLLKLISNYFELIALAGIGIRVNFKELIKQGFKLSFYAFGLSLVQIISAITLITLLL